MFQCSHLFLHYPISFPSSVIVTDQTVCVFDVRKPKKPVTILGHTRAVTSAFYSGDGSKILTTCYDNFCRVYSDIGKSNANSVCLKVPHDNQTGRWITRFMAHWCNSDTFVIGNMKRGMDIFTLDVNNATAQPRLSTYKHEYLTAIPSVNAAHPVHPMVASATASGKVVVWHTSTS
jgi:WD repeat-containing protein 76